VAPNRVMLEKVASVPTIEEVKSCWKLEILGPPPPPPGICPLIEDTLIRALFEKFVVPLMTSCPGSINPGWIKILFDRVIILAADPDCKETCVGAKI